MAQEKRTAGNEPKLDSGPYIARIIGHLDPNYMGALEVELLKSNVTNNDKQFDGQTFKVGCAFPFYGQTPVDAISKNKDFKYSQQSYGMWFVPPDVGTRVLVTFVEGQPNQGYWFGCVPDNYTNFSMPDMVATTFFNDGTKGLGATESISKTGKAVVGEINKKNLEDNKGNDPTKFKKPINNTFNDILLQQGIESDGTRGLSTASARREVPSTVFGVSTPGPLDKGPGAVTTKYGTKGAYADVPASRLGGTHFVMDDGDDKILRKGPASTTAKEYVNVEMGEKGDVSLPHNELMRIRTRTGHQILFHNTEDLIRIDHGSGNSWIEMSANGKIDVYSKDSISMHTENDLNITADRDINLQAGRKTNIMSKSDIQVETGGSMTTLVTMNNSVTTKLNYEVKTCQEKKITAVTNKYIISGGNHTETASQIHMNGPQAATAVAVTPLSTHVLPGATATAVSSLHKRLPQHEPWGHHENVAPADYTAEKTDRENDEEFIANPDVDGVVDTFKKQGKK